MIIWGSKSFKAECGFIIAYLLRVWKIFLFLRLTLSSSIVEGKTKPNCNVCKDIVSNFHKGLASTAKSNFGGGNTKWEEKSLKSYAISEVRLVEIMEHLCDEGAKECHSVVEEHEELVERYWFKEFAQKRDTDFYKYFCIENMKACCPNNTYGPNCSQCPGDVDRPCNGQGYCQGEGTREGDGKCNCNSGYRGDICEECRDGFFEESKNDTHTVCKVCHIACKNTCWEGGPKGCDECKDGWLVDEEQGCIDVNECLTDPCEENQFCTNTQGSYTCFSCDDACVSCTGAGPDKCQECSSGYTVNQDTNICQDTNECEEDSSLCQGEHLLCRNKPGSYDCQCESGYQLQDGVCIKDGPETESVNNDEINTEINNETREEL
ncbi:cysteine-rich with EGF-like domain protein 2-B isoform X2 [Biomphalaria glabrata]|uniref:protein disulfide-isomerase n=1 Tax=Biomphalaria glabrata TaxID=6526 RepID=A0A9W3A8F2_BIOGL|nr:cysteine-rich with EGF-like domain protein 2-B isoform X2 [Biomphalaria glabrata]